MIFDPTSQWPLECLFMTVTSLFYAPQTAVTITSTKDMRAHTHTCPHTCTLIILALLFPECPLSLGSFDCIDCNDFSVYMMMNIILLLLLLLLQPLFLCTLLSGSRFDFTFSPLFHIYSIRKKQMQITMIIIVVVIRMIIPGSMSVSQYVCNNVAMIWTAKNAHAHEVDFPHFTSDSFCFFFFCFFPNAIQYVWFNECSTVCFSSLPPSSCPFPLTSSLSVSLAVFLCSLSVCSAKPVSK